MVPKFEKYVRQFWNNQYGLGDCTADSIGRVKAATAGKAKNTDTRFICVDSASVGKLWRTANDLEKDTYEWEARDDGALNNGDVTGEVYVFDSTGSFNGKVGWREAESIEKQYGGCREALFDSIRTDKYYAYYYTCKKSSHNWVREKNYLIIDTQYWPDSSDGKVKWGDSIGVATPGDRICYVWDEAKEYNGWREGNTSDCELDLLGCTAKRNGEMRKAKDGRYFNCTNNEWIEIVDDVYTNTYLYRCTKDESGDNVFSEGEWVYGIDLDKTHFVCDDGMWRKASVEENLFGETCTSAREGVFFRDSLYICSDKQIRMANVYDYPIDKDWTKSGLDYGELYDKRDKYTYKTIKIGNQVWMAENLKYADSVASPYLRGQSWCYQYDPLNCLKGGRYYSWMAAMDIGVEWEHVRAHDVPGFIGNPHRGICPEGSHIPNNDEWNELFASIGESREAMLALNHGKWPDATNASGFSAVGVGVFDGPCQEINGMWPVGELVFYWSADELKTGGAVGWILKSDEAGISNLGYGDDQKHFGASVRCILDTPANP